MAFVCVVLFDLCLLVFLVCCLFCSFVLICMCVVFTWFSPFFLCLLFFWGVGYDCFCLGRLLRFVSACVLLCVLIVDLFALCVCLCVFVVSCVCDCFVCCVLFGFVFVCVHVLF